MQTLPNPNGMPEALKGVRVLDCSQILAGPFCSMLLADMGADVVKIEKPNGGDDTRRMGPPFIDTESAAFLAMNRNKRSIVLNFKEQSGVQAMKTLVKDADIVIENYRTGTMARLGLGYEDLKNINPGIIYCSISGFGRTGPYANRGGFDLVAQGHEWANEYHRRSQLTARKGRGPNCGYERWDVCYIWHPDGLHQ